jgi:hypothetical protein
MHVVIYLFIYLFHLFILNDFLSISTHAWVFEVSEIYYAINAKRIRLARTDSHDHPNQRHNLHASKTFSIRSYWSANGAVSCKSWPTKKERFGHSGLDQYWTFGDPHAHCGSWDDYKGININLKKWQSGTQYTVIDKPIKLRKTRVGKASRRKC